MGYNQFMKLKKQTAHFNHHRISLLLIAGTDGKDNNATAEQAIPDSKDIVYLSYVLSTDPTGFPEDL